MSLRIVRHCIKLVSKQDNVIAETRDNLRYEELEFGKGNSILSDYLQERIFHGRQLYTRLKKHFDRLTKRQQKRVIYQAQASRTKRKVTDKLSPL